MKNAGLVARDDLARNCQALPNGLDQTHDKRSSERGFHWFGPPAGSRNKYWKVLSPDRLGCPVRLLYGTQARRGQIVVGGFVGQWAAINRFVSNLTVNYWFGHQGWEFVDLGRFWQVYLVIGL